MGSSPMSGRDVAGRAPAWGAPALTGLLAATGTVAVALLDPATRAAWSPGCPFRALTGLDCPGCGGTRSLYALTQGDLVLAADHNLLVVVLLPVLAVVWGVWLVRRLRVGRAGRAPIPPATASMGFAVAVTLFWLVRNLPWAPFVWLGSAGGG